MSNKPNPCDAREHEQALIGSILLDRHRANDVAFVTASMFGDEKLRTLWPHVMLEAQAGREFESALFVKRLQAEGDFERAGGMSVITACVESVVVAHHAAYHAHEVYNAAQRRAVIDAAKRAIDDANDPTIPIENTIAATERKLRTIDELGTTTTMITAQDAAQAAVATAKAARERLGGNVLPIEIGDFDRDFGGLARGELIVLAARPGNGKTSWAMQAAVNNAANGRTVLVVSLEMAASELALRSLASHIGVSSRAIRVGTTTDVEIDRLVEAADNWQQLPLLIYDAPRCTIADIRRAAKSVQRSAKGLSLVVVDYIGLVTPNDSRVPRHEQVGQITRDLKQLARDLNIPVLALAQLNRQSEQSRDGKPKLSHLRESGNIEQDADVVAFIHREDKIRDDDPDVMNVAQLIVAKNRNGPTGEIELYFDAVRTRFSAIEHRYTEFDAYIQAN